jgi:signal transduction histidine kinase
VKNPENRRAICTVLPVLFGALGIATAAYLAAKPGLESRDRLVFILPAAIATVALAAIPFTRKRIAYYILQVVAIASYFLMMYGSSGLILVQIILFVLFLGELVLLEPYPVNMVETIGLTVATSAIRVLEPSFDGVEILAVLEHHAPFFVPGVMLSVLGSLMTKHRELVVGLSASNKQLTESLVSLAKTNTVYQDYAVGASERATEHERLRIVRDIHDIVGYTLTNNMMLMEAALDLMKENALALPAIIETSRSNAEEGLEQVRAAMYKLREQENTSPVGLKAIARLSRIFEQATSIHIRCDFNNMPMAIDDEIDSGVYHLVQESLVNSFRHGKATEVSISFWYDGETVQVMIRDNGIGGAATKEGIGLSGMRERIEELGGSVHTGVAADGFVVNASIPLGRTSGVR